MTIWADARYLRYIKLFLKHIQIIRGISVIKKIATICKNKCKILFILKFSFCYWDIMIKRQIPDFVDLTREVLVSKPIILYFFDENRSKRQRPDDNNSIMGKQFILQCSVYQRYKTCWPYTTKHSQSLSSRVAACGFHAHHSTNKIPKLCS